MQKNSYLNILKENDIKIVVDYEGDRLFKVTIPINKENEKSILVVTRSPRPSKLDDCVGSLGRAIKYFLSNDDEFGGIKQISFVFVFPVIEYTKDALEEVLNKKGELFLLGNEGIWKENEFIKNDLVIFEEMIDSSHIVFAWGEPPKELKNIFEYRLQYILKGYKMVKNNCFDFKKSYVIGGFTNQGYPRHYLSWRKDDQLVEWDI